ncbi:MAG: hypothetical protein JWP42_3095 [Pseudomonas sp.]|nr:hypothetical protein [Pseudomonas sp.]
MHRLWRKYRALLDNDLNTKIFDNIKNLLVCAFLFAAGTNALHSSHQMFLSMFEESVAGWGLIGLSAVLMLMNISDGLRRLARLRHHVIFQIILFLLYIVVAERIVEIVWSFRAE